MDDGWLRAIEDAQRQTAEVHSAFQRTLSESHMAFLRMAESTMAGLLGASGGDPVGLSTMPAPAPPVPAVVQPVDTPLPPPPPAPEPKPEPEPGPETKSTSDGDLGAFLLSVVAERTGYPAEILNLDMALEADLGIDSIKRVEILSALRNRIGELPGEELSALTKLRTLREVVERFDREPENLEPENLEPENLVRRSVRFVAAAPSGLCLPGLRDGTVAVTDDGQGIAVHLVDELRRNDIRAELVSSVPADARGVILLEGLRQDADILSAFSAARSVAARMEAEGGAFVLVHNGAGGLAALARTAAKEWPRAAVKAIDCTTAGRPAEAVAKAIAAELVHGAGAAEVRLNGDLNGDRTRLVPEVADAALNTSATDARASRIGAHSVIVASGGARGATAAALRLLAERHRPRLVLLGQTALTPEAEGLSAAADEAGLVRLLARNESGSPAEVAAKARRILAVREIRENLRAIEDAGSPVRYLAVDVRDAAAVRQALDEVRREWGPITGLVHGAGVLADARIGDKTDEQFSRVYLTKVDGLGALLDATAGDPLEILVAFSSVAAVFGNPGQADYAMANETLHHMLAQEQASRPDCLVRAIAWGPWAAGMVTPTVAERFRANGVPLIEPAAGASAFLAELSGPANGDVLSILTPSAPPVAGPGVKAEVFVNDRDYPYLKDHRLGETTLLPVATVLDWFAGAANAWRPNVSLSDLRVLNKVTLPDGGGGDSFAVDGQDNGSTLDLTLGRHYRATAGATTSHTPPPRHWIAPPGLEPHVYPYEGTTLFHGPALRVLLGTPSVGRDGADCAISPSASPGRVDVPAVDGVLQLALLWARRAGTGDTLPMAINEIRLHGHGPLGDRARCVVLAVSADDTNAVCDAALLDSQGQARVELIGIHLVRRPGL